MRRLAAHFALAAICLGALAPIVSAAEISDGPACCRRSGVHHCQVAAGDTSSSSTELRATRAICPYSAPLQLTSSSGLKRSEFNLTTPNVAGFIAAQGLISGLGFVASGLSARAPPILLQ